MFFSKPSQFSFGLFLLMPRYIFVGSLGRLRQLGIGLISRCCISLIISQRSNCYLFLPFSARWLKSASTAPAQDLNLVSFLSPIHFLKLASAFSLLMINPLLLSVKILQMLLQVWLQFVFGVCTLTATPLDLSYSTISVLQSEVSQLKITLIGSRQKRFCKISALLFVVMPVNRDILSCQTLQLTTQYDRFESADFQC